MAVLANLSFEDAGVNPGEADGWTIVLTTTGAVADFSGGTGNPRSIESYVHGWANDPLLTGITGGTGATFSGNLISPAESVEDYAKWVSIFYRTSISGGVAAEFGNAATTEEFVFGWPGADFEDAIPDDDPDEKEDYDANWPGDPLLTTISGGTAAAFNTPGGTAAVESYTHTFQDVAFTVDIGANDFVCQSAHGLTSNQKGEILSTGKRPGGVPAGVYLHVIVVSSTRFQVSVAPGPGGAVTLSDIGYGEHRFKVDRAKYWTEVE